MEAAMKKFPGSMPTKERWIAIAEEVEGKTAKDAVASVAISTETSKNYT